MRGGVGAPFYRVGGERHGRMGRGMEQPDGVAVVVAEGGGEAAGCGGSPALGHEAVSAAC
jgi:hypothetical protein